MSHLNHDQLSTLTASLQKSKEVLIADIKEELLQSNQSELHELANGVHDRGEEAISALLLDVEHTIIQAHRTELHELEQAQLRIQEESYGQCEDCGCDIPFARLQAAPSARCCIQCQEKREQEADS